MKCKILFIIVFFLFSIGCKPKKLSIKTKIIEDKSVFKSVDRLFVKGIYEAKNNLELPFRLYSPKKKNNRKILLVIFLYGRGERG
ncbi:MAG: hypothetical protein ABJG40_12325 [Polaribacter sp.]|uniref:hypothetical protein n=1 Tax=Polaribacter sp. TaxID=1920175 RepID=UPI003265270A